MPQARPPMWHLECEVVERSGHRHRAKLQERDQSYGKNVFFFFHYRWPDSRFNWSGAPWRISYFLFRAWQQLCHTNWHTHHCSWSASAAHFVNKSRRIKIENLWHDDIRKSCATAADWKLVNTKGKALEFFNIPRSIKCQGSTGSISVCFPF